MKQKKKRIKYIKDTKQKKVSGVFLFEIGIFSFTFHPIFTQKIRRTAT